MIKKNMKKSSYEHSRGHPSQNRALLETFGPKKEKETAE
jgi:hypothetical protein